MTRWVNGYKITSKNFDCAFCGNLIASSFGYTVTDGKHNRPDLQSLYICPHCDEPNYFSRDIQVPGVSPGEDVLHLPENIKMTYAEARNAAAGRAPTAAVLICRKLLMNIAVEQGAKAGETFISYVNYLADKGFVPPNGREWVDHIRSKGNEAAHEIQLMTPDDAMELIGFTEMLLKFIYEFPNKVPKKSS